MIVLAQHVVSWWAGSRGDETCFVIKVHGDDGSGGVYEITLLHGSPSQSAWAVHMRERGRLQVEFERAALRQLIAGKGQAGSGWTNVVRLLELEGINVDAMLVPDIALLEHKLSTPAALVGVDFMRAAMTAGWVSIQRPRDEWHGLMAIPADETPIFIPTAGCVSPEPSQLAAAVWGIHRRRDFTTPALFEVAAGGDSPLQLIDLLAYDGVDLRERAWAERRALLIEVVAELEGAGAQMRDVVPLAAFESLQAVASAAWQLWLTPADAPYGSGLRYWKED